MNAPTTARFTKNFGTLSAFLITRAGALVCGNKEQTEAFTREFYGMALQVVNDNDFSEAAQTLFPEFRGCNAQEMRIWWRSLNLWYFALINDRDRALLSRAEIIW